MQRLWHIKEKNVKYKYFAYCHSPHVIHTYTKLGISKMDHKTSHFQSSTGAEGQKKNDDSCAALTTAECYFQTTKKVSVTLESIMESHKSHNLSTL